MDESELKDFQRRAGREGLSLSEWVRRVLREAARAPAAPNHELRLEALERALQCGYPTAEVDVMLAEIDAGRDLR